MGASDDEWILAEKANPNRKLRFQLRTSLTLNVVLIVVVVALGGALAFGGKPWSVRQADAEDIVITGAGTPTGASVAQSGVAQQSAASLDQTEARKTNATSKSSSVGTRTDGGESRSTDSHVRHLADDPRAIGDIDAPVVISVWIDLLCPYCADFMAGTFPVLVRDYVDRGLVRVEFNDVYFASDDSRILAIAAQAAAEQDYYLPFIQEVYGAISEKNRPEMTTNLLLTFAGAAGVPDLSAFATALDSAELAAAVDAGHDEAVGWGITSVPFFVVGNHSVSGTQSEDSFLDAVDTELAASRQ